VTVLVDTSAWIALLTRNDPHHPAALTIQARLRQKQVKLLTSDYIVDETVTWLRYRVGHAAAVAFWETTLRSALIEIAPIHRDLLEAAWGIFKKYADQELSLTDCTSFALMRDRNLKRAFTFDRHFLYVGFEILPFPST
jgi:predicted nucleic acid-binding protein